MTMSAGSGSAGGAADGGTDTPPAGLELRSVVRSESTLEVSLLEVPIARPGPDEVLIRVEAAPINPSDLGLLFAGVDVGAASVTGPRDAPVVTAALTAGA